MYGKDNQMKYHELLKDKMDKMLHQIYDATLFFPKDEQFGVTSQIRRAALSIILNYIEGYGRQRKLVLKQFLEISYGSLKETKYLLYFSYKRKYLSKAAYSSILNYADEVGRMLWGILEHL